MLELYDAEMKLKHAWNSEDHWGCAVDSTVQEVTVALPAEPCPDCTMRFTRQALEWGANYLFKSCAKVNIAAAAGDACQGCSGHGTCGAAGACVCDSSAETGFFYGANCERENECAADADCGANGKCIDVGDVSGPALQVRRRLPPPPGPPCRQSCPVPSQFCMTGTRLACRVVVQHAKHTSVDVGRRRHTLLLPLHSRASQHCRHACAVLL